MLDLDNLGPLLRQLVAQEVERVLRERDAKNENDDLLLVSDAAKLAHAHPESVRRWVKQGRLTRRTVGRTLRISRRELEALLRRGPARRELSPEEEADLLEVASGRKGSEHW